MVAHCREVWHVKMHSGLVLKNRLCQEEEGRRSLQCSRPGLAREENAVHFAVLGNMALRFHHAESSLFDNTALPVSSNQNLASMSYYAYPHTYLHQPVEATKTNQ
jgi:hypothetical protein